MLLSSYTLSLSVLAVGYDLAVTIVFVHLSYHVAMELGRWGSFACVMLYAFIILCLREWIHERRHAQPQYQDLPIQEDDDGSTNTEYHLQYQSLPINRESGNREVVDNQKEDSEGGGTASITGDQGGETLKLLEEGVYMPASHVGNEDEKLKLQEGMITRDGDEAQTDSDELGEGGGTGRMGVEGGGDTIKQMEEGMYSSRVDRDSDKIIEQEIINEEESDHEIMYCNSEGEGVYSSQVDRKGDRIIEQMMMNKEESDHEIMSCFSEGEGAENNQGEGAQHNHAEEAEYNINNHRQGCDDWEVESCSSTSSVVSLTITTKRKPNREPAGIVQRW